MLTSPTPESCEIFCASRVSARSSHARERQGFRGHGQRHHWRVGRIRFAVDGRRRQIERQKSLRCIDRRLHFLFGHVNVQIQRELQGDDRAAVRAHGRHLVQSRHLAKLPLQRRGNGRSTYVGTCAGIKGDDLNRRIIHLRQRGNAELPVCDRADKSTAIISSEVATGRKMNRREGFTLLVRRGRFRGRTHSAGSSPSRRRLAG